MSDTPESDKAMCRFTSLFANEDAYWVHLTVARKLERERDSAIADINLLCDKVLELNTLLQAHGIIEHEN